VPVIHACTVKDAAPFIAASIVQQVWIWWWTQSQIWSKELVTPHIVHVSSAGVNPPDRPGLDLTKQPLAVHKNKDLSYILTFKLKGEDLVWESGILYTIVRPCALTEEPAGVELIFEQGDNITGKIFKQEIAHVSVAALESLAAWEKTFEVWETTGSINHLIM
jgi:hypothetical protein